MCGIAGYWGTRRLDDETVGRTLGLMRRRGPDAANAKHLVTPSGTNVHLLHTRLSILDLDERSHQPFHVGHTWLAYNGELYNYVEVRAALQQDGAIFATTSDTEVLARALDGAGSDETEVHAALDRCEGMWAFASYDDRDGSLLLCRDRFAEKPLYLYRDETGLYFGSEAKFVFSLLGRRLDVDHDHIARNLVNGYKALYKKPHSFFVGLEELPPASTLRLDGRLPPRAAVQQATPRRYWTPGLATDEKMSYDDAVAGTRERLIRSVELRLRSDVPLAFCMSGGVDSNSLIAIAKKKLGYDVHGFTIANSDARYEESELVDHAVQALGLRHTSIPTRTDHFLEKLRILVAQHDAPVYTITYYAHWLLMEAVREHGYKISISGSAADELFTGYYDHHLFYLAAMQRGDAALHKAALDGWTRHVKPIVRNPFLSDPERFVRDPGFRDHIFLDADGFSEYLTTPWREAFAETRFVADDLRNRMANELFHEAVPVILHEDDLNAMYYSIENRSPFLDRDLVEFAYSIPTRHLIRDGMQKVVLRDSMRGIVPSPILDARRKVGFNAPIESFLDHRNADVRAAVLDDSPVFDWVRRDKIEALMDRAGELPNHESKFLFNFVCTKMFLEENRS